MHNVKLAVLFAVCGVAGVTACADGTSIAAAPDASASLTATPADAAGSSPVLLKIPSFHHPDDPPRYSIGCAQALNNEGFFSGWYYEGGGTFLERWDRTGKLVGTRGGPTSYSWVLGMNDRGQVLGRAGGTDPYFDFNWVFIWNPDGSVSYSLPTGDVELQHVVRMNRTGNVIATYDRRRNWDEPPWPPAEYIFASDLGELAPPIDPSRRPPAYTPEAECVGEAIDDLGRVYSRCSVNGRAIHYRWSTASNPVKLPDAEPAHLADVRIHDVNRYGELAGESPSGAVYWSASTGRIEIPRPPGVSRLEPVGINDRGVILLSSDYYEGEINPSETIAYWTRAGGTIVLEKGGWPEVSVQDINNRGVIAGCVGGDGGKALQPAYWRIN